MGNARTRDDAGVMPRYRRHFARGQAVFLTLAAHGHQPRFLDPACKRAILDALRAVRAIHPFAHHGHVLLHDHLHLLLSPRGDTRIPSLVGSLKRAALARFHYEDGFRMWQRRYHDHIIRDADDFRRHLDYLHFNPVKHGLVARASAWPWSSLAAWQARDVYPMEWGDHIGIETSGI